MCTCLCTVVTERFTNMPMSRRVLHAGTRPITTDYRWNSYGRIIDVGGAYVSAVLRLPWLVMLWSVHPPLIGVLPER